MCRAKHSELMASGSQKYRLGVGKPEASHIRGAGLAERGIETGRGLF